MEVRIGVGPGAEALGPGSAFTARGARGSIPMFVAEGSEIAGLLGLGSLLGSEIALEQLLERLVDRIRGLMEADRGTLYLVDRPRGELFSRVADLPELSEIRLKLGQGVAGHVALSGEVVNVPTTSTEARFFGGVDEQTGYRTESMLAVPVRDRTGAVIGVIQLLNARSGRFSEAAALRLLELARQAATIIEASTLYETLQDPGAPPEAIEDGLLTDRFNRIIGEAEVLREACRRTRKAAASQATVLIRGESGTGKELFARAVHVNSPRRDAPFVKVDCAALPPTLIENELFGHEKGAYTGADERAGGKLDAAEGGTLFLDELGELPLEVQGKLLRVLQDRCFQRVGGIREVRADVRVVAATNRDLATMVKEGRFRADLYYRIKVVEIVLPPLRARGAGDIQRLARYFLAQAARRHGLEVPSLSSDALARLARYSWPGNVRELENCMESGLIIMDGDVLHAEHLPLPSGEPSLPPPRLSVAPAGRLPTLAEVERAHILQVLDASDGNRTEAARRLGIGRNTLARKLKQYGL